MERGKQITAQPKDKKAAFFNLVLQRTDSATAQKKEGSFVVDTTTTIGYSKDVLN
jgi:hypothetical protein